jgi:hypothetical protein
MSFNVLIPSPYKVPNGFGILFKGQICVNDDDHNLFEENRIVLFEQLI